MNRTLHDIVPATMAAFSLVAIAVMVSVNVRWWAVVPWVGAFVLAVIFQVEHEFRLRRGA